MRGSELSHAVVVSAVLGLPPACCCLLVSHPPHPRGAWSGAGRGPGAPSARLLSGGRLKVTSCGTSARSPRSLLQCHPAPIHSRQKTPAPDPAPGATGPDGRGSKTKVTLLAERAFSGRSYFCCGCELKLSRLSSPSPRGWGMLICSKVQYFDEKQESQIPQERLEGGRLVCACSQSLALALTWPLYKVNVVAAAALGEQPSQKELRGAGSSLDGAMTSSPQGTGRGQGEQSHVDTPWVRTAETEPRAPGLGSAVKGSAR